MNIRSLIAYLFIAAFLLLSACTTFYKVRSVDNSKQNYIEPLNRYEKEKYQFVMHSSDLMWALDDVELSSDKITGKYSELGTKELFYYENLADEKSTARVPFYDLKYIYQIHIYVNKFLQSNGIINISDKDIEGVNIYDMNGGLTVLTMAGTTSLVAIGALAAVLAIACSCPHVYSYDGTTYNYEGGMFTGAISPQLERYDYKILPDIEPEADHLSIMVKSNVKEEQYINNLALMVVEHEKNTIALPDQSGKIHTIKDPQLPIEIRNDDAESIFDKIAAQDEFAYNFNTASETGLSNVYASFDLQGPKKNIKLVLNLSNTKWGGFVYNEFSKLFGWYHDDWVRKNQKKSREEMESNMKDQGITMLVSVKTGDEWTGIEEINLVGDAAFNKLVIPIDEKFITSAPLEVRLQCGYMFWQIDYLAIDNTPEKELNIYYPELKWVTDENNVDPKNSLSSDDEKYLQHIASSDSTFIGFESLVNSKDMMRTLILKSKGYYLPDAVIEGKLNLTELRKFKQAGELSRYSKELYDKYFEGVALNY
jgi:hypothetical protein